MYKSTAEKWDEGWGLCHSPVQSERFGNFIEVNPLGRDKICSFDCPYCYLGASYLRMNKIKKDYVFPTVAEIEDTVRTVMRAARVKNENVNRILVSGNGDPSLYPHLAELIQMLKRVRNDIYPEVSIEILTNGAKINTRKAFDTINEFERVHVKLDAGSDDILKQVNTPLVRTSISHIVSTCRKIDNLTIQSLFLEGAINNTSNEEVEEWIESISLINPKEVHIYTLNKNTLVPGIERADENRLYFIASILERRKKIKASVFF